jgi:hypothetical protein
MLNLSGLTTKFKGNGRPAKGRRHRGGVEVLMAFNTASQMALLYPPGIDELMRRELELDGVDGDRRGARRAR